MNDNIIVGVDIGGSHITAALIDLHAHAIIKDSMIRNHVNSKGTADEIINEWAAAIEGCKKNIPGTSNRIGIAMPGPFDYKGGTSFIKGLDKYEALYNLNVKHFLANKLHIETHDIFMNNDATCFLKGEVFGGAAKGQDQVIGITLGTGLGSAVCKNGNVDDGDLYCTGYKDATAEDYLSTRWFIKRYKEMTGNEAKNVKDIRDRLGKDPAVNCLFIEFGKNLGEVLAAYIKKHNADAVVLGGNIIHAWELFAHETTTVIQQASLAVTLLKAHLGEEAALLGAGSLCCKNL